MGPREPPEDAEEHFQLPLSGSRGVKIGSVGLGGKTFQLPLSGSLSPADIIVLLGDLVDFQLPLSGSLGGELIFTKTTRAP